MVSEYCVKDMVDNLFFSVSVENTFLYLSWRIWGEGHFFPGMATYLFPAVII